MLYHRYELVKVFRVSCVIAAIAYVAAVCDFGDREKNKNRLPFLPGLPVERCAQTESFRVAAR